jgi:hypothetical protein
MPIKKEDIKKRLSPRATIRKPESPYIAYLKCEVNHLCKYQLRSKDEQQTFRCKFPKCSNTVVYYPEDNQYVAPKATRVRGGKWLKNMK